MNSPVFVTANYKLSFDLLRSSLKGRDGWVLVLDTKGVNVWCAAGKGTFCTEELVRRIEGARLSSVVHHREVILPQLSAPGIAAHLLKHSSGFKALYGPVHASDLPAFLDAGLRAAPHMRRKSFDLWDRMVLIPVDLFSALKIAIPFLTLLYLFGGLGPGADFWAKANQHGLIAIVALLAGILGGTVLTPVLLPLLPGRSFSLKGFGAGILSFSTLLLPSLTPFHGSASVLESLGLFLMVAAVSSYYGMNFTGASTYTSLSGVKKEMKWAVPFQALACALGLIMWGLAPWMDGKVYS